MWIFQNSGAAGCSWCISRDAGPGFMVNHWPQVHTGWSCDYILNQSTIFYLLKTGLDQVIREKVSDQIQKGVQTAHFLVLGGGVDLTGPEFWVPGVYSKHQDYTQNSSDYCGGHVVHHCSGAHSSTGASIQTGQACEPDRRRERSCINKDKWLLFWCCRHSVSI